MILAEHHAERYGVPPPVSVGVGHEDEQERTSEVVSGPDLLRGRGHTRIGIAARCIQSHHIMDRSRYWMAHGGRRGNPVV